MGGRSQKSISRILGNLKPTKVDKSGDDIAGNNHTRTSKRGQLLIQCGAYGNLQHIITLLDKIAHSHQFKAYFTEWNKPWHFAKPEDTDKLLEEVGYVSRKVYSMNDFIVLPNRNIFSKFMKTIVMKSYLEQLSIYNDKHT